MCKAAETCPNFISCWKEMQQKKEEKWAENEKKFTETFYKNSEEVNRHG